MSEELKPCPFCGEKPTFGWSEDSEGFGTYGIHCENPDCYPCPGLSFQNAKEAREYWNKRAERS